jgi:hypothetical protein
MNITQLAEDILIMIIDEMNENISHVSIVNKEFQELSKNRLRREREKVERRIAFFEKCRGSGEKKNFYWNAFNGVITLEECDFLYNRYASDYDFSTFISRVRYTLRNTYQITKETWTKYLMIHDPKPVLP